MTKKFLSIFLGIAAALTVAVNARAADNYPSKPITIVVPFAPGGGSDELARLLADHLQRAWKQTVVIENKPGANAMIGATYVARAEPDGYTLLMATPSSTTFSALIKKPTADTLKDFAPIYQLTASPYLLAVNSQLPIKNIAELVAYAKANPGKLSFGEFGGGQRLAFEYFKQKLGLDIVPIQYRGESPMVIGLLTNDVQVTIGSALGLLPQQEAGKVRILGVSTSFRAPTTPDIPTFMEGGVPDFDVSVWYGVYAPARTPVEIQKKLSDEFAAFAARPDIARRLAVTNFFVQKSSPEKFGALVKSEIARWNEVGAKAGIEPH